MKLRNISNKGLLFSLAVFFSLYIIFALFLNQFNDVWWDEASYIGMSKFFLTKGESGILEPMKSAILPILLIPGHYFSINIVLFGKLLILFFSAGSIALIYLIGKELWGERTGTISSVLFMLNPLSIIFYYRIYTEMLSVFFVLGSIYFFIKYDKYSRYKNLFYSAFFCALAIYSKYPYALIPGIFSIYLIIRWFKGGSLKPALLFILSVLIFLIPFLLLNWIFTGNPVYLYSIAQEYFRGNLGHLYDWRAYPVPPLLISVGDFIYFQSILYLLNIIFPFFLLGIYWIFTGVKTRRELIWVMILPMATIFLFFEFFYLKQERYILPVFAIIAIISGYAISKINKKTAAVILLVYALADLVWVGLYLNNPDEMAYASFFSNPPKGIECERVLTADPRSILRYDNVLFPYEVFDDTWEPSRKPGLIIKSRPDCVFYFSCAKNRSEHHLKIEGLGYKNVLLNDNGRCTYAIYLSKSEI